MTNINNNIITYTIPHDPQEYLAHYAKIKAQTGHKPQNQWSITDTVDPNEYMYIHNFHVYATIQHRKFVPKGTEEYDPWSMVITRTKRGQYIYNEKHIDITALFVARFNNDNTEITIEPRNRNTYTWIKNNELKIFINCVPHKATRNQRHEQKQLQQHERFYNKMK